MKLLSNVLFVRRSLDLCKDIKRVHTRAGNEYIGINVRIN